MQWSYRSAISLCYSYVHLQKIRKFKMAAISKSLKIGMATRQRYPDIPVNSKQKKQVFKKAILEEKRF